MIAIETVQAFRIKDIIALFSLALLLTFITLILQYFEIYFLFYFIMFLLSFFLTITVFLVRKAGSATLFFIITSLISYYFPLLGILSELNKFLVLTSIGIIFELFFLVLKLEIKNIPIDVVFGAGFSIASFPWLILFLTKIEYTYQLLIKTLNVSLSAFFIALIASCLAFLLWYEIKKTKIILRYEFL
ncbi:hypothetical protein HYV79_01720 [Candidatus Woesearchaeota archaeon]|nr:hypothetical protein [Candidatus Woesearchaeota archaeon]